ncbi:MAG: helix-turn-helix domain-containing protein [Gammaproteobacteria bacterium]
MHKDNFDLASSERIEDALSERLERLRLSRNITQAQLAAAAGVSRSTISRLGKQGKGISLDSFIRILKALQLTDHLHQLLPDPDLSPLEQLDKKSASPRQRARPKKASATKWSWNEDAS